MLINRDMIKKDLREGCELSTASMAKLAKGRNVNTDVLVRICNFLRCDISDICEVILSDEKESENLIIREIAENDYPVLEDFLYNAIYMPPGEELPPREVIFDPEIYIYVDGFGSQPGDYGVVAKKCGKIIGAAWTRIIPAYGHIDDSTPELAISVLPDFRGQKIGTMLIMRLFDLLCEHGYKRTSLSVQKNNPAVRFYERLGYIITGEKLDHVGHEDYIMLKELGV